MESQITTCHEIQNQVDVILTVEASCDDRTASQYFNQDTKINSDIQGPLATFSNNPETNSTIFDVIDLTRTLAGEQTPTHISKSYTGGLFLPLPAPSRFPPASWCLLLFLDPFLPPNVEVCVPKEEVSRHKSHGFGTPNCPSDIAFLSPKLLSQQQELGT